MNRAEYDKADPTFIQDLKESQHTVWHVAQWLGSRGNKITVNPIFVRPTAEDMEEFSDEGDMEIAMRGEVRRLRKRNFHSFDEYPFNEVIVDVAHKIDNAKIQPFVCFIVNADEAGCMMIFVNDTRKYWTKRTFTDRGRERTFYLVPKKHTSYTPIPKEIEHGGKA